MRKKTTTKKCNCVNEVNALLEPKGYQLDWEIAIAVGENTASGRTEVPLVAIRSLKSKRTRTMHCNYCPFCGAKKP